MSTDEKSPVDAALDLFLYAPIGLVFDGPALLPKLVERGRNQVAMARTIGQFAVQQGQTEATKVVARLAEQASGVVSAFSGSPPPPPAPSPRTSSASPSSASSAPSPRTSSASPSAGAPSPTSKAAPSSASTSAAASSPAASPASAASTASTPASPPSASSSSSSPAAAAAVPDGTPAVADLAIPDYDGLSASQVVARLAGLARAELGAVRAYEAAHRGRKTILNKIAQLQRV